MYNDEFSNLPTELLNAIQDVYQPAGMKVTKAYREKEGKDYGACRLQLDCRQVIFRIAKTTPKKIGQFVTVWQRPSEVLEYVPFNVNDDVEFIVVSVSHKDFIGQFVFNKKILISKGIIGSAGKRGKGAFRVYAPWIKPDNATAIRTQQWQVQYFLSQTPVELDRVASLFNCSTFL